MKFRLSLFLTSLVVFSFAFFFLKQNDQKNKTRLIKTIYGSCEVSDPALLELFDCDAMQRLKKVDQYGFLKSKSFSRYDHSVGVWFLLKKFGASREEQIAGLLHDASHTVFSHVGDKVFKCAEQENSYQDDIHEWYLQQTSVVDILKKHNIPVSIIDHKSSDYRILEQDLPDICADRLEYNLRGGLVEGLISQEEVTQILDDLRLENGKYFFTNTDLAKKFAEIPLYLTEHVWGSYNGFVDQVFLAHALLRAVEIGLITIHDIHFSTDDFIFKILKESNDGIIKEDLKNNFNSKQLYSLGSNQNFDKHFRCKFRGLDPWVKLSGGVFRRLTSISKSYSHYYKLLANKMKKGFYIKFVNQKLLSKSAYLEEVFAV